jgi:hypothetical protein
MENYHSMEETEHFKVNYPNHVKRTSSHEYEQTHKYLCKQLNLGCFICGKNHPEEITETHHYFCEYADMNGYDWISFGKWATETELRNPQTGHEFAGEFDWEKVQENPTLFVDSIYNMVVLCEKHHRDTATGIHHVPYPLWLSQKFAKDGFVFLEKS